MATAAVAAASSTAQLVVKISTQTSKARLQNAARAAIGGPSTLLFSTKSLKGASRIRAAEPDRGEEQNSSPSGQDDSAFLSQEDWNYLIKLGAGSVAGAAAIKYGSVIFPEITRPSIVEALSIISFPVIAAVILLIQESSTEK